MADVDAILASGSYTDRRGTWWGYMRGIDRWVDREVTTDLTPAQMRQKIVRDLHRTECPGLQACGNHPVPRVILRRWGRMSGLWGVTPGLGLAPIWRDTLTEALDAARHMTGGDR